MHQVDICPKSGLALEWLDWLSGRGILPRMCYFLIVTIKSDQVKSLESALGSFSLSPVEDLGWLRGIRSDDLAFWLTDGHCGCGLYARPSVDPERLKRRLLRKLANPKQQKKARAIQRALEHSDQEGRKAGLSSSLTDCLGNLGSFGLWVQWGDSLPRRLKHSDVERRDWPTEVIENVFYSVACPEWTLRLPGSQSIDDKG